ncbi:hypothetical protein ACLUWM_02970 [Limosilactobacillus mucosae]
MQRKNIDVSTTGFIKKALFTVMTIIVYSLGNQIPVPLVKATAEYQAMIHHYHMGMISILTGANLPDLSLFSLGFSPYMAAMMIIQLLVMMKWSIVEEISQRQLMYLQNILSLLFALIEAAIIANGFHLATGSVKVLMITITLTAGAMFVQWLGNVTTIYGIGGMVVLIVGNMLHSNMNRLILPCRQLLKMQHGVWLLAGLIVGSLLIAWLTIIFHAAHYETEQIQISLPSQIEAAVFPIGFNLGTMMTFMLGMSFLIIPSLIASLFKMPTFWSEPRFQIGFAIVMTFLIDYFFAFVMLSPRQLAKGMRHSGNYLLGVEIGRPTRHFIRWRLVLFNFFSALILSLLVGLQIAGSLLAKRIWRPLYALPISIVMMVLFMESLVELLNELSIPKCYQKLKERILKSV